ncbi:MAG: hypothetical protein GXP38_14785 [Chloroflexi bacterium]|nr:hypothetical protein [Chloroflexota bacterium]
MTNSLTSRQIIQRFQENELRYAVMPLQDDTFIIISERGGRVFGPFLSPDTESMFWVNEAFADAERFRDFLASGDWNMGGERVWIAPETQYLVRDRADFWGTIHIPEQMDPGVQFLSKVGEDCWKISQNMLLEAYNFAAGQKQLRLDKWFRMVEDPLRNLAVYPELSQDVRFAGYQQTVHLSETRHDEIVSESWNLIQVRPGGQILIPTTSQPEYSNYFAPVDSHHLTFEPWGMRLQISGRKQYKVGVQAAQTFGRLAYFHQWRKEEAYLIVRNFFNNPSALYAEEPAAHPHNRGRSIHVYNDDGALGGFGEFEVNGQTIGGKSGRSETSDQFILWFYLGTPRQIKKIASFLLGTPI